MVNVTVQLAHIPDEADGMVGVGGTYHWYVTAEKSGEYEFTAYEMPPAGNKPTGRIVEPVAFVKKTDLLFHSLNFFP